MLGAVHLDFVAVHFSTRCGAACSFCYFSDPLANHADPTPFPRIKAILEKLAAEEVQHVLFVGGDPVVHPDLVPSLRVAKELGLTTSVLSNSWSIRPLKRLPEAVSLIDHCEATVLGATAGTHDAITQRPGSYRNLIRNLQLIGSNGKDVGICINAVPQNHNELYETVGALRDTHRIPIRSVMIQRIIPSGGARGSFKFGLNLADVDKVMAQLERINREFSLPILFEDPVPWCAANPKYHYLLVRCEWGYTRGSVNSEGLLNRCGADDHYRLGNIWDGNIQELWSKHPILQSFRSKKYLAEECQTCDLLEQCGGGCPLSCGTLTDHGMDELYLQKMGKPSGQSDPISINLTGSGCNRLLQRYATESDLPAVVELEREIFGTSSVVFTAESIGKYFASCPQAFRVASVDGRILGYSAIFPLNDSGLAQLQADRSPSVIRMDPAGISRNFNGNVRALYLEVIAASSKSSFSVRHALLRDFIRTSEALRYPFTLSQYPILEQDSRRGTALGALTQTPAFTYANYECRTLEIVDIRPAFCAHRMHRSVDSHDCHPN